MKKYLLIAALLCFGLNAGAQIIVRPQAYCSGMSDLDAAHKLGNFVFGDSITKYLWDLKLIETDKKGNIKTSVHDSELGFFRLGGHAPTSAFLESKNYLIRSLVCFYHSFDEYSIKEYMLNVYGVPNISDDGEYCWNSTKFFIMAWRAANGLFCVGFTYDL